VVFEAFVEVPRQAVADAGGSRLVLATDVPHTARDANELERGIEAYVAISD
jgi:hypothetical protein